MQRLELSQADTGTLGAGRMSALWPVIDNLHRYHPLSAEDRAAVEALPFRIVNYPANRSVVRDGERVEYCGMLLEGYACRYKLTSDGSRQIVSFHVAGDILDAQHLELECADHNVLTITAATVALVAKADMQRLVDSQPTIRKAIWRNSLVEASIFREWVLNIGRRNALTRVAHMLCEFATRREVAQLGPPNRFELPMSQEQIADATGLTSVHVNRMMKALGRLGVIERNRRQVTITDWDRMRKVADFDPAYLHIAV